MCRVLAYLGEHIALDDLLYGTDSALIRQFYEARMMSLLELGGFGMMAWAGRSLQPQRPFVYKTPHPPVFDHNLESLVSKLEVGAVMAHVRGVLHGPRPALGPQNVHPFRFAGAPFALAMNGDLDRFSEMRFRLLDYIRPEWAERIEGQTDTEWIYSLVLSQLPRTGDDPTVEQVCDATERTLAILRAVRERCGIATASPLNLVIGDGRMLVVIRFTFDYGWYGDGGSYLVGQRRNDYTSLWFTVGSDYGPRDDEWVMRGDGPATSIMVASDPITKDRSTWVEAPDYSMLSVAAVEGQLDVRTREIVQ